jgi:hypothetical protein
MARKRPYTTRNAYRTIERIRRKTEDRAEHIARLIVDRIQVTAPEDPLHEQNTGGPKLKDSYYVRQDPLTGDFLIASRRRYWAFVEFGTRRVNPPYSDAQPHIRPAVDFITARLR